MSGSPRKKTPAQGAPLPDVRAAITEASNKGFEAFLKSVEAMDEATRLEFLAEMKQIDYELRNVSSEAVDALRARWKERGTRLRPLTIVVLGTAIGMIFGEPLIGIAAGIGTSTAEGLAQKIARSRIQKDKKVVDTILARLKQVIDTARGKQ